MSNEVRENTNANKETSAKLRNYLSIIAVIVFFILAAYMLLGGVLRLAIVEGISMEPLLHTGDVVLIKKEAPDQINVGDIVVYSSGTKYIIHRVIEIKKIDGKYCYVVKGDNNPMPDPGFPECHGLGIPYDAIVGVVQEVDGSPVKIPYVGGLSLLVRG
ncbi:MAG: signal peptidase I [Desulfurococcales archaeon]|nr:signal peptidase I [Desulfurococcales archaeon]MEB3789609.1 signal peptidase I [Desulfurococcales archaeon]